MCVVKCGVNGSVCVAVLLCLVRVFVVCCVWSTDCRWLSVVCLLVVCCGLRFVVW